jgi:hypothetical protein
MTGGSIREYAQAVRVRYWGTNRKGKKRILDEFTQITGYHRKAAIRLLGRVEKPGPKKRKGRHREYGPEVAEALKLVWEASDYLCSRRLHDFMPEWMQKLAYHNELKLETDIMAQLCRMSASTIDRLLRPYRVGRKRRSLSTTRPGSLLKASIPIRTFGEWGDKRPGFLEIDLVAHCGESTQGFYLTTLSAVDIATRWAEYRGVWGKSQTKVGGAIHDLRRRFPFPIRGLDSDNGGEFINHELHRYCLKEGIEFTRSRPYKKNDNAHVEQKNSWIRRLVGYERYESRRALELLNHLYELEHLWTNFFQPVSILQSKTRHGAKVHKVYDAAQTPCQRLLASGILDEAQKRDLERYYRSTNPVRLKAEIEATLKQLWKHATHPKL